MLIIFNKGVDMELYTERIRGLREDHDKTQAEIAQYLHTTQQVYSRYEKGVNEMPIRHLISLCQYYHVSADYILGLASVQNGPQKCPSCHCSVTDEQCIDYDCELYKHRTTPASR